ncbi:MAG: recombinase A [Candidatus Binatia bacterium]
MNSTTNLQRAFPAASQQARWTLPEVAGRLVEISAFWAPASLSLAFSLVLEAQRQGEPVSWVMSIDNFFYPPDAAQAGVDLGALVIVRVPYASAIPRAAEKLLRSGAFGLIVLDIGSADIPMPLQARLGGLVRQHHTTLICLTEKEDRQRSLGSLISLRAHAKRTHNAQGQLICNLEILKDKRRGPTWSHTEVFHGP